MPETPKDRYFHLYPRVKFGLKHIYGYEVEGSENIPTEPAILVANHIKAVDSLLMAAAFTEVTGSALRFGAKSQYFTGDGFRKKPLSGDELAPRMALQRSVMGRVAKWLVESTGQIPVVRGGTREDAERFFNNASAVIRRGDSLGIHAEGTRSPDGRLYKFRYGAAQVALRETAPIVPVGLVYDDCYDFDAEINELFKKPKRTVIFGSPIYTADYKHIRGESNRVRTMTNDVEKAVAELTGQERAGVFAEIVS